MKIINSGHSYDIVSAALDTDLYVYLQPAATELILENKKFTSRYMESLRKLDELVAAKPESKLGERLFYILRDFVEQLTDWEKEKNLVPPAELYKRTWAICRNFVLPMNPQRTELDYAVRKVLVDLGIQIKKKQKKTSKAKA